MAKVKYEYIKNGKTLAQVTDVFVKAQYTLCPHFGEEQHGRVDDPRNKESTCDDCGDSYHISSQAEFVHV